MKKNLMIAAGFATGLLAMGNAAAATTTTTFQVTATVANKCIIDSASDMAFGDYSPTDGDKSATSDIVLRCSKGGTYNVGLDGGTTGTVAQRLMANGSNTLQYNLYQEASHTTIWGNTVGTDTVAGTGNGMGVPQAITHTVYGQLLDSAFNQDAAVGSYADTITVTVTY